jgi:hypothetical protein
MKFVEGCNVTLLAFGDSSEDMCMC